MKKHTLPSHRQAGAWDAQRNRLCNALLLVSIVLMCLDASAGEPDVPVTLQAELTCKVAKFDRHFAARSASKVIVLIAFKKGAVDSERIAKQVKAAFEAQSSFGGMGHEEVLVAYSGPAALLADAERTKAAFIVLAPGVSSEGQAVAQAFDGYDGVTVSTSSEGVEQGIVLGFDLVSGKPKMLLNLEHARRQHADFRAEVLKLMKVYP
jgi:YfiR/HmsC-like